MSAKSGVYLRAPGRSTAPGALVSVSVSRWQDRELDGGPGHAVASFAGCSVAAVRRVRGKWCRVTEETFDRPDQFWRWLDMWANGDRKTYLVAPTASDALVHLGFFQLVDTFGAVWDKRLAAKGQTFTPSTTTTPYVFRRLVLRGSPDIVDYSIRGRSYCWLSARNYFHHDYQDAPTATMPTAPVSSPPAAAAAARVRDRWQEEAMVWLKSFTDLSDWWLERDAGSFAPTAGSLAERFLRSRMPARAVVTHRNEDAQRLERLAAHRGRTSCWFVGHAQADAHDEMDRQGVPESPYPPIRSELIHIDVRSMYPWLLTVTDLPVKLLSYRHSPSVDALRQLSETWLVTAAVRLDTPHAEYPHRGRDGISYPTGRFTAYLSGAELRRALADGIVTGCHECAVYLPGRPFAPAAQELIDLRTESRVAGNAGWELFVKLLSVSLTGKLAQKRTRWIERPGYPPQMRWGAWAELNATDGTRKQFRALAALVWEQVREEAGTGLLTACYGHLTAACSDRMRGIREKLPGRCVISQDTDGIWCLPEAAGILVDQGEVFGEGPGQLRVTARSRWSRFWGAKHYFAGGVWKLSGMGSPVRVSDGLTFFDQCSSNAVRRTPLAVPTTTVDTLRAVTLGTLTTDGPIGADGWITPRVAGVRTTVAATTQEVEECDGDGQHQHRQSLFDE